MAESTAPHPRRAGALATALLGATLLLSALLAWVAARAATSQRRATTTALHNYADIAAWQYARAGRAGLSLALQESQSFMLREFLRPVRGIRGMFSLVAPADLPGPDLLRRVLSTDPCQCLSSKNARAVFRIMPDGTLTSLGDAIDEPTRRALVSAAYGDSAIWGRHSARLLPAGAAGLAFGDYVVVFRLRLPTPGRAFPNERPVVSPPLEPISAVYGMVIDAAPLERTLRQALGDAQVLAPSLLARLKDTTLVRITVSGATGPAVFTSGPNPPGGAYVATDTIGEVLGHLTVRAALDEEAATRLLLSASAGPSARMIAVLVALTLLLGAGALLVIRREQQLVRLRQDFVASVSHELRTPITQIRLHSELLLAEGFHSVDERRRALGVVHRESLRMTSLIDNVLRFGRRRVPRVPQAALPLSLGEVAREVRDMFQPLAAESGATLVADAADETTVAVNRDTVTRILCNLVENALKYGPRGQTVRIATGGGTRPTLVVDDEGPGIPAVERDRIWDPFYRLARDRNAPRGGTGLGLSVVAELVASLGGSCRVEERPGGGARFVVML